MKKTMKKALSVMLVVVIMLTAAPLSGFVGLELPEWLDVSIEASAETSGTCGEKVTWTFDESTGTLTISGTGEMDENLYWNCPWEDFRDNIETIIINDGVTIIGDYAFYDCNSLTSVTIPDSVTSIGDNAFYNCSSLIGITIPDSVSSIGSEAFYHCDCIKNISVPDSVTLISYGAFEHCYSLTSVTIPDSVTTIDAWAFGYCHNLTSITIPDSVTSIGSYAFLNCESLTNVDIPDSVTVIDNDAFRDCTRLADIIIGDGVTTIGLYAFYNCTSLTSVTIPDSVISIDDYIFHDCTALANVTIGGGVISIGNSIFEGCESLTRITVDSNNQYYSSDEYGVLFNKDKTTLIQYPVGNTRTNYTIPDSVTLISYGAFKHCYSLTSVTIPDSVTSIGDSAFKGCTSLASVTIPDNVTTIGDYTFYSCDSLTDVYYSGTEEEWNNISIGDSNAPLLNAKIHYNSTGPSSGNADCSIYGHTEAEPVVENYVAALCIADGSYDTVVYCSVCDAELSRFSVTVPATGHTEGEVVVENEVAGTCGTDGSYDNVVYCIVCNAELCRNYVVIEATGEHIYANEVSRVEATCTADGEVIMACGCGAEEITVIPATGHSYNSNVTAPTCTKQGYTTYTCSACYDNYTLDYVDALGHNFIDGVCEYCETSKTSFYLISNDEHPSMGDIITVEVGILNNTGIGGLTIDIVYDSTVLKALSVKSKPLGGTHNINYDENKVRYLNVVSGEITDAGIVLTIEFEVLNPNACEMYIDFVEIFDADYVPVPVNSNILYLCSSYCENDEHEYITVSTEATCIKQGYTTYICSLCGDSYVSNYVDALGYHSYNSFITEPTCTEQGYTTYTCSGCGDSYTTDEVPALGHNYVDGVCEYCGERSENPSGTCGENVTWTFETSTGILTISGTGEMYNFEELNIRPWEEYITDITSIIINDGPTSIEYAAFYGCSNLKSVTIPDSVTSISQYAFAECSVLTDADFGNGVTSIGHSAFNGCTSLKSITIPDGVTTIKSSTFEDCTSLASITIPDSVTTIGSDAFYGCSSLTSITIPDSVTTIGDGAFRACESLTNIIVDNNNSYYSSDNYGVLFNKNKTTLVGYPAGNKRTSYTIPDSATSISDNAFYSCKNLVNVTIGDCVTTIGSAFLNCTSLINITIPDGVTSIESWTFYRCTALTSITISESVTSIGMCAFEGCASLTDVYYSGTEDQWNELISTIGSNNEKLINATIHYNSHSHIYETSVTVPTCTEQGYTTYTCSVCDDSYISDYIEALGHTAAEAVEENYLAPTCTEKGSKDSVVYCSVCDEELSRETIEIEAFGHTYESVITEPTCTEQGYITYACSVCDYSYDDDYTEALGHTEAEAVEENYLAPTCTEKGSKDSVV